MRSNPGDIAKQVANEAALRSCQLLPLAETVAAIASRLSAGPDERRNAARTVGTSTLMGSTALEDQVTNLTATYVANVKRRNRMPTAPRA